MGIFSSIGKTLGNAIGGLTSVASGGLLGGGGGGGGGGGKTPALNAVDEQIRLEQAQAAIREEERVAAEQRAASELAIQQGTFDTGLGQAFNTSLQTGTDFFNTQGVDLDRFLPLFESQLNATRSNVPNLASNPSSFFDPRLTAQNILSDQLSLDRKGFNQEIDQFAGDNFAFNLLPGTFDDATIAQILAEQFADASAGIERAGARGSLTDFGTTSALANLEKQNTAAGSRLQDLGGGILEGNRVELRDIAGQARSRADAFQFGDTFSPSSFQDRINTTFGDQTSRLEGDIRGALGGESLFNIGDILARASSAQGSQNNVGASPALLAAIAQRDEESRVSRGIGTQGAF